MATSPCSMYVINLHSQARGLCELHIGWGLLVASSTCRASRPARIRTLETLNRTCFFICGCLVVYILKVNDTIFNVIPECYHKSILLSICSWKNTCDLIKVSSVRILAVYPSKRWCLRHVSPLKGWHPNMTSPHVGSWQKSSIHFFFCLTFLQQAKPKAQLLLPQQQSTPNKIHHGLHPISFRRRKVLWSSTSAYSLLHSLFKDLRVRSSSYNSR